ncbi:MAG: ABC transporter permease [Emergencia timonensis]|uniref:ABC transporter permease n=1 Tax=Emergencia timonensis TaxID=1776384 RepID=UPI001D07639E|nr:ABC transporter permease [Emergencia timonensis]MCB6478298.1 ABC transporter permease [Emergencia timonensis]WNX87428.1 ABC transporter permease [Emergencia timonensis]
MRTIKDTKLLIQKENFFQKFVKHKMATVAFMIIAIEVIIVFLGPVLFDIDPYFMDSSSLAKPPSSVHLLGTDDIGRDIFARMLYGGRISLAVGVCSTLISFIIGIPLGLCAGYFKGKVEFLVMRCVDIFQSFPGLIMILVLVAIFGSSVFSMIIMIGVMGWIQPAKIVYGATLSVCEKDFVESARSMGASHATILIRHILPNVLSPVWILIAFRVSGAIIMESSLSFLGAGIRPPQASWGNIINAAQNATVLATQPWIWLPAGIVLFVTIICINLIGEGVRDALDPKMKR